MVKQLLQSKDITFMQL